MALQAKFLLVPQWLLTKRKSKNTVVVQAVRWVVTAGCQYMPGF